MKINELENCVDEHVINTIKITQETLEEIHEDYTLRDSPYEHRDYSMGCWFWETDEDWAKTRKLLKLPEDCEKPTAPFILLTRDE